MPQRAVTQLQGSYQLAVVDSANKTHIRPVKVGDQVGSDWIIESGVAAGEQVVVEGLLKVKEGTRWWPNPFSP